IFMDIPSVLRPSKPEECGDKSATARSNLSEPASCRLTPGGNDVGIMAMERMIARDPFRCVFQSRSNHISFAHFVRRETSRQIGGNEADMKAYLVLDLSIHDLAGFRKYIAEIPAVIARHSGR